MVPTLNKEELRDRMLGKVESDKNKSTTIEKILRKKRNAGKTSAEDRISKMMGKFYKKPQPKTGLENIDA